MHGSFFFEPRAGAWEPYYLGKPSPADYNLMTAAPMSFVAAGNTTLWVHTSPCPRLGCPSMLATSNVAEARNFSWSDMEGWRRADVDNWEPAIMGVSDPPCSLSFR